MANLSYKVDSSHQATIFIRGEIVAGDAERFEQFAEDVCRTHLDPELPSITAALDSDGGDYLDGLALGNTFRRLRYGTRVDVLGQMIAPEYCRGPIANFIRAAIQASRPAQIDELFDNAKSLNAASSTSAVEASRIIHVRGFEYGALFYVTDCYVIASNGGSANLALSVVKVHFQNHPETVRHSPVGDILYEVHLPNTVMWPPTPGPV